MDVRRGFIRLWMVFSVVWIAGCLLLLDFSCFYQSGPWCAYWGAENPLTSVYLLRLAVTFGVPLAVWVAAVAIVWIGNGFGSGSEWMQHLKSLFRKMRASFVYILRYFGFGAEEFSPLALRAPPNGKSIPIADSKRAEMLRLLEGVPTPDLQNTLRDPGSWDKFRSLRMSDAEISGAVSDHLRFRWRVDEQRTAVQLRRVILGVSVIAIGVCILAIDALT